VALPVAVFAALAWVGVLNHEMWRDELEIWLVARDSGSLFDLARNLRTQGHPAVWYLAIFAVTRVTQNPLGMQLLSVAIGTFTAWLVIRWSPFPLLHRLLFVFGYYSLYELTVISRHYGLTLALTFLFCALFCRRGRLSGSTVVVLWVLANTSTHGAIIAANAVLLVLLRALTGGRAGALVRDGRQLIAIAVVLLGVAAGLGQVLLQGLAMGSAHTGVYSPTWDLAWLTRGLATVGYGYLPFPDVTRLEFWNSNLLGLLPGLWTPIVGALLGMALWIFSARQLRSRPAVMWVFVAGSLGLVSVILLVWYGWLRHHGQVFLWFVACCWLWYAPDPTATAPMRTARPPMSSGLAGAIWIAVLFVQFGAGAYAYAFDLAHPFSSSKEAGRFLQAEEFVDVDLVGSIDYAVQPIAAYIDRPIYYPESRAFGTFIDWGPVRRHRSFSQLIDQATRLLDERGREIVLILSYRPAGAELGKTVSVGGGIRMRCFARFAGAIVADENYHLCHLFRPRRAAPDVDTGSVGDDNER
jgi:hypothetical protein